MKFVIEHLEPKMWEWCVLEYQHISETVGRSNVIFSNVLRNQTQISPYGKVTEKSVKELGLKNACLLDPSAPKVLSSSDAKEFDSFVFGGILGDYPMKFRTKELLPEKYFKDRRNIGTAQFSTDTAVYVTKQILEGAKWREFHFVESMEIAVGPGECIELPFRYVIVDGKPFLPRGLIELLLKKKGF